MALSKKKLESNLLKILKQSHNNFLAPAKAWAWAYTDYAKSATGCLLTGLVQPQVLVAQKLMTASFVAAFSGSKDPINWCTNTGLAISTFWLAPPLAFIPAGPNPGVIGPFLPTLFVTALLKVIVKNSVEAAAGVEQKTPKVAKQLASALHKATKEVPSIYSGVGGCSDSIT